MASLRQKLTTILQTAISQQLGPEFADTDPVITQSTNDRFGDYQANFAMKLAKTLHQPPRQIAEQVQRVLADEVVFSHTEVAGPGFINLVLDDKWLAENLSAQAKHQQLGVDPAAKPQTVVIDYGSANIAKEMHIGHLRSPVLGDAMARALEFCGHRVIRQNHLGDWGTQFGMLLQQMEDAGWLTGEDHSASELNKLYQAAKKRYDEDEDFAKRARAKLVALQAHEPEPHAMWQQLVAASRKDIHEIYRELGISITEVDDRGESSYNEDLQPLVDDLVARGVAMQDAGAMVVPLAEFKDPNGKPVPLLVQKTDGGFLYATTDLAALRYRLQQLRACRVIYVVDARQKQHFAMLFAVAAKAGWLEDKVELVHQAFGSILGHDKKPFKTRSGESVKLRQVLDEACVRAYQIVSEKNSDFTEDEKRRVAKVIGISSVKYADLANDLGKDYVFDWEKMLAFEGNSAPYLLNAYVRIQALFRKADWQPPADLGEFTISNEVEHGLALALLRFAEAVELVARELTPHKLCTYLCDVAKAFHHFYEHCPVLKDSTAEQRKARLKLCQLTSRVFERGLQLLGIETLERM